MHLYDEVRERLRGRRKYQNSMARGGTGKGNARDGSQVSAPTGRKVEGELKKGRELKWCLG